MATPTMKFNAPPEMSVLENDVPIVPIAEKTPAATPAEISNLIVATNDEVTNIRRLIVLVPTVEVDDTQIAREIWEIASSPHLAVMFLGLCKDITEESRMRRRLAMLAALTRDPRINIETQLEYGNNFIRSLRNISQKGDVIICHAEQQIGLWHTPLSEALEKSGASVWTLSGFYPMKNPMRPKPFTNIFFWSVSILILAGFFWFQAQTLRLTVNWAKNSLLYVSVFVEIGLLWVWHKISS